jgi:biopolymer transport protein ExbD
MEFERNRQSPRHINMVPLINIILLMLVFFLVAGTVEKFEIIDVDLPEATSSEVIEEGHVQILLGRYDEIVINDKPCSMEEVGAIITDQLKYNKDRVITLKADARMKASRMIAVLDRIKAAGGKNLSLVTQEM